jgi:hypothetical protein
MTNFFVHVVAYFVQVVAYKRKSNTFIDFNHLVALFTTQKTTMWHIYLVISDNAAFYGIARPHPCTLKHAYTCLKLYAHHLAVHKHQKENAATGATTAK